MDLRSLEYFVGVVDQGTFTAAARAAHVSQPALSHGIDRLETELGARLFERLGRRVQLTAAGEALVGPARGALREVDAARAAVEAVAGIVAGHLDLGALPTLAADPLARVIGEFRRAHPGVTMRIVDAAGAEQLRRMVESGECEIGFTVAESEHGNLAVHPLGRQDLLAVFPPGERIDGATITAAELARHALVTGPPGAATRLQLDAAFAASGVSPTIAVTAAQREVILPLVLSGAGATLLAAPLAEEAAALGAVVRPLDPPLQRGLVAIHRPGPLSPAGAAFLELALA